MVDFWEPAYFYHKVFEALIYAYSTSRDAPSRHRYNGLCGSENNGGDSPLPIPAAAALRA
jgi:hypothetical protein